MQNIYSNEFKAEVSKALDTKTYLGLGNPSSKILVVGKEVSTDLEENQNYILEEQNLYNYNKNALDWDDNIKKNISQKCIENWIFNDPNKINNPIFAFKGALIKEEGKTWRKYQKLHDNIFKRKFFSNERFGHNFQERFFITEMSDAPSKTTGKALQRKNFKRELENRKNTFLKSNFIQNFPVVILACNDYITGNEIEEIFTVNFCEQKGNGNQLFWTHYNTVKTKLVIHTRQLSTNVSNNLISEIAEVIRYMLKLK